MSLRTEISTDTLCLPPGEIARVRAVVSLEHMVIRKHQRCLFVVVDASASMRGAKYEAACSAVEALCGESPGNIWVFTFGRELSPLTPGPSTHAVTLLRAITPSGSTDLPRACVSAMYRAAAYMAKTENTVSVGMIVITDCDHTTHGSRWDTALDRARIVQMGCPFPVTVFALSGGASTVSLINLAHGTAGGAYIPTSAEDLCAHVSAHVRGLANTARCTIELFAPPGSRVIGVADARTSHTVEISCKQHKICLGDVPAGATITIPVLLSIRHPDRTPMQTVLIARTRAADHSHESSAVVSRSASVRVCASDAIVVAWALHAAVKTAIRAYSLVDSGKPADAHMVVSAQVEYLNTLCSNTPPEHASPDRRLAEFLIAFGKFTAVEVNDYAEARVHAHQLLALI